MIDSITDQGNSSNPSTPGRFYRLGMSTHLQAPGLNLFSLPHHYGRVTFNLTLDYLESEPNWSFA